MEVKWMDKEPPVDETTKISKQLVVLTNYGYLNTAYWSARTRSWLADGMMAHNEHILYWLDGLTR